MAIDVTHPIHPSHWQSFELLQQVIDSLEDPLFVKDIQHRWIVCNQAFCAFLGKSYAEIIGHSDPEYFPREQVEVFWRVDDEVTSSGEPRFNEELVTAANDVVRTIWTRKFPVRNEQDEVIGLCGIITDITAIKQRQAEIERLASDLADQRAVIESQTALLDQLAVPVIQVWERILLLPLIGFIDSHRAAQVLTSLLDSITRFSAQVVILDLTGVPIVDTTVASYLMRAVQATELLGCQSILVAISPEIAQTLVGLGIDFSHITTRATLQTGLEYALKRLNYMINRGEK